MFNFIHIAWWAAIAVGYKFTGCTEEDVYPDCFMISQSLFFGVGIMIHFLRQNDYLLEWSPKFKKERALFKEQSEVYYSSYMFLCKWHLAELFIGKFLTWTSEAITCSSDGDKWFFRTGKGNLFLMMHIIGTMQSLGMTRKVFSKSPSKVGFFDSGDAAEEDSDKKTN